MRDPVNTLCPARPQGHVLQGLRQGTAPRAQALGFCLWPPSLGGLTTHTEPCLLRDSEAH